MYLSEKLVKEWNDYDHYSLRTEKNDESLKFEFVLKDMNGKLKFCGDVLSLSKGQSSLRTLAKILSCFKRYQRNLEYFMLTFLSCRSEEGLNNY